MSYGVEYYTVKRRDEFSRIRYNIDVEQGLANLTAMQVVKLAGNYRIAQYMNHRTRKIIKIEGPEKILEEFIQYLGV